MLYFTKYSTWFQVIFFFVHMKKELLTGNCCAGEFSSRLRCNLRNYIFLVNDNDTTRLINLPSTLQ